MPTKLAINGFGRIGRAVARILLEDAHPEIELVAINDLTDAAALAHLLKYDTVHRTYGPEVTADETGIQVGGKTVNAYHEKDPAKLPWADLGVDVVLECTGRFRTKELASKHIEAGAKKVLVSAPCKGADGTYVMGVNDDQFDASQTVISNASCTTNCLAPMVKVIDEAFGLIKGHVITVHSYTNDQRILDLPHHKDYRRARAAAENIIPTTTGAAKAIGLVLPELDGKLTGAAIRVPTPNVSLTILTAHVGKETNADDVNAALKAAAEGSLKGILGYEEKPLVSIDYVGNPNSSIIDALSTSVMGGDQVQVTSWYDNEWGFSERMVDLVRLLAKGI